MHQLIVLGNGFDLECGLDSKFSDFFEERKKVLHPSEKELDGVSWDAYIRNNDLTAWDIILDGNYDSAWHDIEETIRLWVANDKAGEKYKHCSSIRQIMDSPDYNLVDPYKQRYKEALQKAIWMKPAETTDLSVAKYLYTLTGWHDLSPLRRPSVRHLLFIELNKLEKAFSRYLSKNLKEHEELYKKRASRHLTRLITAEKWSISNIIDVLGHRSFPDTSVLDFNYTNPIKDLHLRMQTQTFVNIHGNIHDKNLIFGIDGKELMADPEIVPFTKTYRLLALNDPNRGDLVHTDVNGLSNVTGLIKFYGHSLNPADYSYFQAIFDGVDLYQSHTRLIFYYKPWKQPDGKECAEAEAQQDMFRKVTRLMNTYGATMENKDHGKNLMHKLLLEGRLTIKRYNG